MAHWLYYTKKMLSTAVTHLADELEQTVINFNDAVHSLSSSQATLDEREVNRNENNAVNSKNIVTVEPSMQKTSVDSISASCDHDLSQLQCDEKEDFDDTKLDVTCDRFQIEQCESILIQTYHVTTTRQPETSACSSTVTSTLPKTLPTLTSGNADENKFLVKQSCQVNYATHVPYTSCKILSTPATSPINHQNFEHRIPVQVCKSPVSEVIARDCSKPNPILRIEKGNHCKVQDISNKRPGKVIRAHVTSVYEQSLHESHRHFIPIIENPFQVERSSSDNNQTDSVKANTGHGTSVQVIVERATHPHNWLSFSTLSRALSFAFSHVVNLLLMAEDESQPLEVGSRPSSRHLSVTYHHNNIPASDRYDFTSQDSYPIKHGCITQESTSVHPSLLRSTQSCESFEIIEQPTDQELEHCSEYVGHRPFLLRMFSQPGVNGEASGHQSPTDFQTGQLESSAEFCNFDFKTLVSDKCVNLPYHFESGSNIFKITTSVVTGGIDSTVTTQSDFVCDNKEDEEDNESVSFTIISENDDEEFISLQLTTV